jgi:ubiquinol-cytochrome c reductase cytochrome c subunit
MPRRHAALSLLVLAVALVITDRADAASADNGRRVFMRVGCWQCHGTMGQGAVTGPKLAPDPLPLDALSSFVRSTNRSMPPYRVQVLSDDDLADIHAYLQSIPKGPDPKSIPLLQP